MLVRNAQMETAPIAVIAQCNEMQLPCDACLVTRFHRILQLQRTHSINLMQTFKLYITLIDKRKPSSMDG